MRFALFLLTFPLLGADLSPKTERQYDRYLANATREMASGPIRLTPGVSGEIQVSSWMQDPTAGVHDGLIHDWVGAIFVPGAKAATAVALLTDFDRHSQIYAPDVVASRLISKQGGQYRSSLRLFKRKVITVVLDTEYETHYSRLNDNRWLGVIRSTRIQEVDEAGQPGETVKPEGSGHGFLWRLNSWWVIDESNGGVLLQLRSISLTREIPFGLSWIIKPMVTSLPRESLAATLEKTAAALRAR